MKTDAKKESGKPITVMDGHELRAIDHCDFGPGSFERAQSAVLGYNGETHHDGKRHSLRFYVNKIGGGDGGPEELFEAWMPYRRVVYSGETLGAAVANMLHGVARLAYDGSMHPDKPSDMGAPPIQHVINVLSERLRWQCERRQDAVNYLHEGSGPGGPSPDMKTPLVPTLDRHNQLIAALGTAIAALGRVNDL